MMTKTLLIHSTCQNGILWSIVCLGT